MTSRSALDLLALALDQAPSERAQFVKNQANGDAGLLATVHQLLQAHARCEQFLEPTPNQHGVNELLTSSRLAVAQTILGPYQLIECIGRGGMGEVWRAQRIDGQFHQQVAIKLIRIAPGTDTILSDKALARAEAEREFLAQLEHPNIARILDGGRTQATAQSQSAPYVVMEYIQGVPIDQYVADKRLSIRARVELFLQVLEAVDCAHRALIIHRDIKPGNVLVDTAGVVKLLDFGIAKSLDAEQNDAHDATQTGMQAMTPSYAAPEQLEGKNLSTPCDVYCAAVMLFELLTGTLPNDRTLSLAARIRGMASTHPVRASQRVDAKMLGVQGRALSAWRDELLGDLDIVLEKALRYEPQQRYLSARSFSDDLKRWLQLRPVLAREGNRFYRLKKFIQRNRLAVAASVSGLIALSVGLGLAYQQAQLTQIEVGRTRLANAFLSDLISSSDPSSETQSESLIDAIDRAEKDIPERFVGQMESEAQVRLVIGRSYNALNRLSDAEKQFRRVLHIGVVPPITPTQRMYFASATNGLADIAWSRGQMAQSEASYRAAIAALDSSDRDQLDLRMDISSSLDALLGEMGRYQESLNIAAANLAALPESAVKSKPDALKRAGLLVHYAYDLHGLKRLESAAMAYQQALDLYQENLSADHPDIAIALNNYAMLLLDLKRKPEAANLLQRSLDIRRKRFGDKHWMLVIGGANLAGMRAELGQHDIACALLQKAFTTAKIALEPNDPLWARTFTTAARVALMRGDAPEAIRLANKAIALLKLGGNEPSYLERAEQTHNDAMRLPLGATTNTCALVL
jgi:eukaryotic-like serine/threonine-protein kinase